MWNVSDNALQAVRSESIAPISFDTPLFLALEERSLSSGRFTELSESGGNREIVCGVDPKALSELKALGYLMAVGTRPTSLLTGGLSSLSSEMRTSIAKFSIATPLRSTYTICRSAHSRSSRLMVNREVPVICASSSRDTPQASAGLDGPSAASRSNTRARRCGTRAVLKSQNESCSNCRRRVITSAAFLCRIGCRAARLANSTASQLRMQQSRMAYADVVCIGS